MEIKERHQVDVDDICLFPNHDKLWKSIGKMLVNQGRNTTEHHEEVHPETMLKIYQLLALLVKVVKARGTAEYKDLLAQLPAELHGSYHNTFQWGAMFILIMFEVRRGKEGMEFLQVGHFQEFSDEIWDFKYIRKIVSESEKNNPLGSNTLCHGVIPDMNLPSGFNPFQYFKTYLSHLPTEPHKDYQKIFLFPMGRRQQSNKFCLHDPDQPLYEQNKKSKTYVLKFYQGNEYFFLSWQEHDLSDAA